MDTETVDSSVLTMDEYLNSPVESSSDAAPTSELLPEDGGIQDEQSSAPAEQVAPDSGDGQPEREASDSEGAETDSSASTESAAGPNWDSDENPFRKDAQTLAEIRQLAIQQAEEQKRAAAKAQREDALKNLASGEVDDADIPAVMDHLYESISEEATAPLRNQMDSITHGFTALVAALETALPPEMVAKVQEVHKQKLALGSTAKEIEAAHELERKYVQRESAEIRQLREEKKTLLAQLAAKTIQTGGESRTESTAVGGTMTEPRDMDEYLDQIFGVSA